MQLSVIIPVLNEETALPALLTSLSWQKGAEFEVLVVDGGSSDGTLARVHELAAKLPYPLRTLNGERGRAHQLNAGAHAALGERLLFLHADSLFTDTRALRGAIDTIVPSSSIPQAARFALHFRLTDGSPPSFGYYFYECKARFDRRGCVHGDQGLLVNRAAWRLGGPFDEYLPLAEDTFFADRIRLLCPWQLIPAPISTSARRFESEGFKARQTLNALLLNFLAIGWDGFFRAAPAVYRQQVDALHLDLRPWWRLIGELQAATPWRQRWGRLWQTGYYVRSNAWQLALLCDAWRNFRRAVPPGGGMTPTLRLFDLGLRPLLSNPLITLLCAVVTRAWFAWSGWRLTRRHREEPMDSPDTSSD